MHLIDNKFTNAPEWHYAYLIGCLILSAVLLQNHYLIISATYAIDYYESSMLAITQVIAEGKNPYTLELLPENTNPYPPLYNIIVAPLTYFFNNTLELHRLIAGLFIVASCILCAMATTKEARSRLHGFAVGVTLYAALLYFSTPVASTNSTGLFFFIASVLIPWHQNFSTKSLLLSLICGTLAFYGKQYFAIGLVYITAYLFLAVSIKKAIFFGIGLTIAIFGSLSIVHFKSPYFLDTTIFLLQTAVQFTFDPMST